MALVVKNLPANAGDVRDASSVPGSGRSPGIPIFNVLKMVSELGLESYGKLRVRVTKKSSLGLGM